MSLTVVYCLLLSTPDFMKRVNALVKEVCVPRVSLGPPPLASLLGASWVRGGGGLPEVVAGVDRATPPPLPSQVPADYWSQPDWDKRHTAYLTVATHPLNHHCVDN